MTRFSDLFGDVFFHLFVIEAAGGPSVILSENRAAPMKVPSCYLSRFRYFRENVDFHSSHFYRESLAKMKNFTFFLRFRVFLVLFRLLTFVENP